MSPLDPAGLLRALETAPARAALHPGGAGGADFASLLEEARAGSLETGLPVSVASGSGIELSAAQLERLAPLVDRAHAAGATRIVVLMDGMAMDVDVLSRRVLGEASLESGRVLTGIDGIVRVEGATAEAGAELAPPRAREMNPGLLRALAAGGEAA